MTHEENLDYVDQLHTELLERAEAFVREGLATVERGSAHRTLAAPAVDLVVRRYAQLGTDLSEAGVADEGTLLPILVEQANELVAKVSLRP